LARAGTFWVCEYLSPSGIEPTLTMTGRGVPQAGEGLWAISPKQIKRLLQDQDWMDICNGNQA